MLSDWEQQELGLIERGLRADGRFAATFPGEGRPPLHRRRWVLRLLIAFGLLMAVAGLTLDAPGMALQGVVLAGASYGWWRWRVKSVTTEATDSEPGADRPWRLPPSVP
jgi:hypothetical protein